MYGVQSSHAVEIFWTSLRMFGSYFRCLAPFIRWQSFPWDGCMAILCILSSSDFFYHVERGWSCMM